MVEKKATIRDVAKLAGVSISTVSRYLNNPTSIKPVAAYRVKKAVLELDYEPNAAARNLKKGKSKLIGVIVPHMRVFFEEASSVITDYFYDRGYVTVLCISDNEEQKERFFVEELIRQQAAGIIIAPSGKNTDYLRKVYEKHQNLVAIDRSEAIGCPMVLENHRENAYQLLKYLLKNGHYDKILFLHGWENSFSTKMCRAGITCAAEEAGVPEERLIVQYTHSNRKGTMEALHFFMASLKENEKPALVAYGTDILEYAVMGIHQFYPEWLSKFTLSGFALPGTQEKLGIECSLVIKNPQQVGATAAEVLYRQIQQETIEPESTYTIPVSYTF